MRGSKGDMGKMVKVESKGQGDGRRREVWRGVRDRERGKEGEQRGAA